MIPKVLNADKLDSLLDDPSPWIHSELPSIKKPALREMECVIVDKRRLKRRQEVLEALSKPYHPLFYTTMNPQ